MSGFFDASEWLSGSGATDIVAILNYSYTDLRNYIYVADSIGSGVVDASSYNTTGAGCFSYELTYTPDAGTYNAGLLTINRYAQGDIGGTLLSSQIANLAVGQTFAVDSFGLFSGYKSSGASDGFDVIMDNVTVVPEPATMILVMVGVVGGLISRK